MSDNREAKKKIDPAQTVELGLERVREALNGLNFGTVTITVHESRVVQIDITEKTRF
jgi:hypothetical protein